MPAKNKPKRLNRNKSWRVARRKRRISELAKPSKRSRAKRPKKKVAEKPVAEKKVVKKVARKTAKKVSKK